MKNETLSPLEQKVYFASVKAKSRVIDLSTIKSWKLTDDKTLLLIIHNLQKKGWFLRLKRGMYLVTEPGKQIMDDPFSLSSYIFNGYVAFSSALYIHKLTDNVPFTIYVATEFTNKKKTIGQISFETVSLGKRAFGVENKNNYTVSTIPKTIYDCVHRPLLAGGLSVVLKAIHEARMNESQWKEFLYYAKKFEKDAFYQRLGYLLSLLPKKDRKINQVISLCKKHVKSNVYLLGRQKGTYIKEWKVIDNVGKKSLLNWWYYG